MDLRPLESLTTFYDCDLWMQEGHHKKEEICQPSTTQKNHELNFFIFTKKNLFITIFNLPS
jgi:hypothetical protein